MEDLQRPGGFGDVFFDETVAEGGVGGETKCGADPFSADGEHIPERFIKAGGLGREDYVFEHLLYRRFDLEFAYHVGLCDCVQI